VSGVRGKLQSGLSALHDPRACAVDSPRVAAATLCRPQAPYFAAVTTILQDPPRSAEPGGITVKCPIWVSLCEAGRCVLLMTEFPLPATGVVAQLEADAKVQRLQLDARDLQREVGSSRDAICCCCAFPVPGGGSGSAQDHSQLLGVAPSLCHKCQGSRR